ncbi:uncharacterized protein LOC108874534 isoform X1 [Lates calcarifer]|uniref:Uncharacterized protein LOC108874534 isoform X1 n=1 Tax=Lates calcarifer TaxID=8187 RepID=A0AAJ7PD78_LATCA|nr:uncharacterized protein LOC108874534 isoform X1 [Lates calcarifer]
MSRKMYQSWDIIPEKLQSWFDRDLSEAAERLVEDYRKIDTHRQSNLPDFFNLLEKFIISNKIKAPENAQSKDAGMMFKQKKESEDTDPRVSGTLDPEKNLLLHESLEGKKKNDCHTRIAEQVRVFSDVTGQTFGAHITILEKVVNCREITVKEANHWAECDVIIVFCPIITRPGSDVQEAMSRIQGNKSVILVLMHHTRNPDHVTKGTRWSENYQQVVLVVHVLFHETKQGLLECEKNENAVQHIQEMLMKYTRPQESGHVDEHKTEGSLRPKCCSIL